MLKVIACKDCLYLQTCKYSESYQSEVDILLTLQNKFEVSSIEVKCKFFRKEILPVIKKGLV